MNELDRSVVATALKDLFKKRYFDAYAVRKLEKLTFKTVLPNDMKRMECLHCIDYADMAPGLKEELLSVCVKTFAEPGVDYAAAIDSAFKPLNKKELRLIG